MKPLDEKGAVSLGMAFAFALIMGVATVSSQMSVSVSHRQLIGQFSSVEGFYASEMAAWSHYHQNSGALASAGQQVVSPRKGPILASISIVDHKVQGNIRRFQPDRLKKYTDASSNSFCGATSFGEDTGFLYKTCLHGRAATPPPPEPPPPSGCLDTPFRSLQVTLRDGSSNQVTSCVAAKAGTNNVLGYNPATKEICVKADVRYQLKHTGNVSATVYFRSILLGKLAVPWSFTTVQPSGSGFAFSEFGQALDGLLEVKGRWSGQDFTLVKDAQVVPDGC